MNGYVAPHPVAPRVGLFAADGHAGSAGEGGILPSARSRAAQEITAAGVARAGLRLAGV
jgi:hypothetical protein